MSAVPPKADINAWVPSDAHHGRPQHQQRSTTMQIHEYSSPPAPICTPWNKGKPIGAKPPLWPKHVWSIRTKLHLEGRILELVHYLSWLSTASCGDAMSSPLRSKTLLPLGMQLHVRQCVTQSGHEQAAFAAMQSMAIRGFIAHN